MSTERTFPSFPCPHCGAILEFHVAANEPTVKAKAEREQRDKLWDEVCRIFNINPQTKNERSRIGKVVNDLLVKGAVPQELPHRLSNFQSSWPAIVPTPEALLKHWDTCRNGHKPEQETFAW